MCDAPDTDPNYSEEERKVYRGWLQTAALKHGRGRELPELDRTKAAASQVARGAWLGAKGILPPLPRGKAPLGLARFRYSPPP